MKNILVIFLIIVRSSTYSQGNLQFNQVINTLMTVNGSIYYNGSGSNSTLTLTNTPTQLTVPVGKVWKIESIYPLTTSAFTCASGFCDGNSLSVKLALKVNGQRVRAPVMNEEIITNNALWLSANQSINFQLYTSPTTYQSVGNYTGGNVNVQFSIIEYNIIP